jgi:2-oxoglutarate ferredoxin oxidoreductase subunit gamma
MSKMTEIRLSGFGGQGVIKMGYILGKGASIYDERHATMTQSFGPEARGSACSSQVIVSDERILYPYVKMPEILVSMSQEAYDKFEPALGPKGTLLVDEDLVKLRETRDQIKVFRIPATRFAEELGRKIVLNIVMLGFFTAVTGIVQEESMREAVKTSVPKGTEKLNLAAFDKGLEYGKEQVEKQKHAQAKK